MKYTGYEKEQIVAEYGALTRHFPEGTEGNNGKYIWLVSRQTFGIRTKQMKVTSILSFRPLQVQ
jgi:hypothetical protein